MLGGNQYTRKHKAISLVRSFYHTFKAVATKSVQKRKKSDIKKER